MSSTRIALALATALAAGTVSMAPSAPAATSSGGGACFYAHLVDNYRAADARTIYARVSGRQIWRLDLKSDCEGLPGDSQTLVVEPLGSGLVCGPQELNLSLVSHGTRHRCLVGAVTKLSAAEAAELPRGVAP